MARKKTVTKRPSYFEAVNWIALNDNAGDGEGVREIQGYLSTALVADLFGADPWKVAVDVERARFRFGLISWEPEKADA
jgi:hypothetical protein